MSNPIVRVIRHRETKGQLGALETGIEQSSGEILFFLDADDVYSPHYLAAVMQVYQDNPRCDFVYCAISLGEAPFTGDAAGEPPNVEPRDLGVTLVRTMAMRVYLGGPTTSNSMRRSVVAQPSAATPCLLEKWR